jgi:predicted PurR-regulated permease PerM
MDAATGRRLTLDRAAGFTWRALVVLAGVAVAGWLLLKLRIVLLPLLLALMLATVLQPVARALRRRGAPPALAAVGALLVAALALLAALGAVVPSVVADADELSRGLTDAVDEIEDWLASGPFGIDPADVRGVRGDLRDAQDGVGDVVRSGVSTGVPIAVQVLTQAVLTMFFAFFVLKDGDRMWAWLLHRVGPSRAPGVHRMGEAAMETLAGYVRGTSITALIDAVFIGLGFLIIGVPLVVPIAVLTFVLAFIPIVGATVAGAVGVLVALADGGVGKAALALGIVLLVQQIEGNVLQPGIVGRRVRLHPMVTIAAVTVGGTLGGIVGAFVAVPVVAVAYRALEELRLARTAASHEAIVTPPGTDDLVVASSLADRR